MNGFQIYDLEDLIAIQDQDPDHQQRILDKESYKKRWNELESRRCKLNRLIINNKNNIRITQEYRKERDELIKEMNEIKEDYNMI